MRATIDKPGPDGESAGRASRRCRGGESTKPVVSEKAASRLARRLPLAEPFDLGALLIEVEKISGVPVVVHPFPPDTMQAWLNAGEALPAAMCIATESRIFIFYREDTSPAHQRHSILHELGHICARHLVVAEDFADGQLDAQAVRRAKHRSLYADDQERAAEAFAYTLESRIGLMRVQGRNSADPAYQQAVERYGSILEG